ncbi:MAG: hypothetical protein ACE5GM_08375 [bacterium]
MRPIENIAGNSPIKIITADNKERSRLKHKDFKTSRKADIKKAANGQAHIAFFQEIPAREICPQFPHLSLSTLKNP